jgi:hypothetical protein
MMKRIYVSPDIRITQLVSEGQMCVSTLMLERLGEDFGTWVDPISGNDD